MDSNEFPRPLKIHVQFIIGDKSDGRFIEFKDDVELTGIASWFKFTGDAIATIFNVASAASCMRVEMVEPSSQQKISTIKIIRDRTGCGLLEAKRAFEMYNKEGCIGVFEDVDVGSAYVDDLRALGNVVRVIASMPEIERGRMRVNQSMYMFVTRVQK